MSRPRADPVKIDGLRNAAAAFKKIAEAQAHATATSALRPCPQPQRGRGAPAPAGSRAKTPSRACRDTRCGTRCSMSPRTQPPPCTSRMAASAALPATAGTYLRSRIGPAGPGTARSLACPMSGGAISVLASVRRYSSRAAAGARLHSGVTVAEDTQCNSASVSRSSFKLLFPAPDHPPGPTNC